MIVTDELLMAYVDGELDAETSAAVAREVEKDSALARQVERHRALRKQLSGAFDSILREPVPEKLAATVRAATATQSPVTDLAAVKDKTRAARSTNARVGASRWLSLAASVVLGVLIGVFAFRGDRSAIVANADGVMAQGKLARALTEDLAGKPTKDSAVRIGVSYEANSGQYCRTFVMTTDRNVAGLACLERNSARDVWRIRVLVPAEVASDANYRTAADAMPAAVLDQVNKEIKGEPFDAEREAQVISRGWTSR